uniref:Uncharacterized protein n=1 Tax=Prolemur simus TaxID=1328070 RepID=A0A8C8YJE4_PROSS
MGKHLVLLLLLLLGLSLNLGFLQALKCFQRHGVKADGVCESGGGSCETRDWRQRLLRKVYGGGRLQHGYQGCGDLCAPLSFFTPDAGVDYVCCKDTPFCNRLQRLGPSLPRSTVGESWPPAQPPLCSCSLGGRGCLPRHCPSPEPRSAQLRVLTFQQPSPPGRCRVRPTAWVLPSLSF